MRSIAYLNSMAIANQIQIYENVRSAVIRLFETGDRYENINESKVNLNSAYQMANFNESQLEGIDMGHSMWYMRAVSSMADMNDLQMWMIVLYSEFEEYLDSINIGNEYHQGLKAIEITINFYGEQ